MATIEDCMDMVESKGFPPSSLHWLLWKNGFTLWVKSPLNKMLNEHYEEVNRKAIEDTYVQLHYMV